MHLLDVINPFGAPVFYEETVGSTMNVSRELAVQGHPNGTVITAGFQEMGRGRTVEKTKENQRVWEMEKGKSLAFTIMLRYPSIGLLPNAITLRAGLAVSFAIEDYLPVLNKQVFIKWPNDIIIKGKKVCGTLCETDGKAVHIGIGINVAQKEFISCLEDKAESLSRAVGFDLEQQACFDLLEKILKRLFIELEENQQDASNWRDQIEARLYKKNEEVQFAQGAVGLGSIFTGKISGIGSTGELLLIPNGESLPLPLFSGELLVY